MDHAKPEHTPRHRLHRAPAVRRPQINLGRSRCAGTLDVDPHGVGGAADRFVWVDVETAFVLKDELRDEAGNVIAGTTRLVTQIEYNVPIAPERFQFDLPSGITVTDCRRDVECD